MLKFLPRNFEPLWGQLLATRVDWWTCSGDMVCDLMFDGMVVVTGLYHCWKLTQDSLKACFGEGGGGGGARGWVMSCVP